MIELSHQASMSLKKRLNLKKRFSGRNDFKILCSQRKKIGFHFENYHPQIKKPVIRKNQKS
jgi:hypothetical protein